MLRKFYVLLWTLAQFVRNSCGYAQVPDTLPLFDLTWNHSIPTLHTSFSTLLPFLPKIASGSSLSAPKSSAKTLIVTLATDQFQHLLMNFLCFLHHRLDPHLYPPGSYLVVTSSKMLAHFLSERGVIVLHLNRNQSTQTDKTSLFSNLQHLDLMLSEDALSSKNSTGHVEMLPWGSLHYQALMLERTLVTTTLVSLLAQSQQRSESQNTTCSEPFVSYDWDKVDQSREHVGGVLLVDNDAVWLSSPLSLIHHHYAPHSSRPSFVYASDTPPGDITSWGESQLACACFFYSRTAEVPVSTDACAGADGYQSFSAEHAALGWRHVSLCHIASTLQSLNDGLRAVSFFSKDAAMSTLKKAVAPSFQSSSLGPVTFLGKKGLLPYVSHAEFTHAMESGNPADLRSLLDKVGLGENDLSCTEKANLYGSTSTVASDRTSLTSRYYRVISSEVLPYSMFPPGRSYFMPDEREAGVEPCVVHANYALKHYKEKLLRKYGLWALRQVEGEEPQCDMNVINRAFAQWQRQNVNTTEDDG